MEARSGSSADRSSRCLQSSAVLSSLLRQSNGNTFIPNSDDQFGRKLVISTRQPPVEGRHRMNSSSSSQLSKTNKRGMGDCQAESTRRILSSSDNLAKSG